MATNWTLVGIGAANTVSTTAPNPAIPAGAQEGDLLVAIVAARNNPTFTPPTGWNLATSQSSGNTSTTTSASIGSGALAWIIHGASAPATQWTLSVANVAMARIMVYRPNAGAVQFVQASSNTLASNSATVTTGELTTGQEDCLIVAGYCGADNVFASAFLATDPGTSSGSGTNTTTAPTRGSWLRRSAISTTTGAQTALSTADAVRQTAGATGTIQCTAGNSSRHVLVAAAFRANQLYSITAAAGAFAVTGQDAELLRGYVVEAGAGAFALTGQDGTTTLRHSLAAEPGAYGLEAADAGLVFTPGSQPGSFVISGHPAVLTCRYVLAADAGQLVATGYPIGHSLAARITAASGAFAVTGRSVAIIRATAYRVTARRGVFATVGYQAETDLGRGLSASRGAFTMIRHSSYMEAPGERRRFAFIT